MNQCLKLVSRLQGGGDIRVRFRCNRPQLFPQPVQDKQCVLCQGRYVGRGLLRQPARHNGQFLLRRVQVALRLAERTSGVPQQENGRCQQEQKKRRRKYPQDSDSLEDL